MGGHKERNILMIGITGTGKSSIVNLLVNSAVEIVEDAAPVGHFADSETVGVTKYEFSFGDVKYNIFDTQGLCDTRAKPDGSLLYPTNAIVHSIVNGINELADGRLHGVFFTCHTKLTEEAATAFRNIRDHCIGREQTARLLRVMRTAFGGGPHMHAGDIAKLKSSFQDFAEIPETRFLHMNIDGPQGDEGPKGSYTPEQVKRRTAVRDKLLVLLGGCTQEVDIRPLPVPAAPGPGQGAGGGSANFEPISQTRSDGQVVFCSSVDPKHPNSWPAKIVVGRYDGIEIHSNGDITHCNETLRRDSRVFWQSPFSFVFHWVHDDKNRQLWAWHKEGYWRQASVNENRHAVGQQHAVAYTGQNFDFQFNARRGLWESEKGKYATVSSPKN
eukprot:Colp12_sorted_trinity150504_noHs@1600